jgi:hypothetical protein
MPLASSTNSTSGVVKPSPGMLAGALLAAGSDAATVIVYDNESEASGTVLCKLAALANTTASAVFPDPVVASKGLYAAVTGTNVSASLYYL